MNRLQMRQAVMAICRGMTILLAITSTAVGRPQDASAPDAEPLSYQHEEGKTLKIRQGDQVLWEFHYDNGLPKPFFHPVATSGGSVLTWNSPPDHPWHHGLWFAWKYINGVNYWEPNSQTRKPEGRTQWDKVDIETRPNGSTCIRMQLTYRHLEGPSVLNEERSIVVTAPDSEGNYHFDWTSTFTAIADKVVLDRTPLPDEPGGEVYGGYAGLSVRFAKELTNREAVSSEGPVPFSPQARYRGKATAMDYAGEIGGKPVGIAICDHPSNLNHPSPWYVIRSEEMSYYSPAVICYAPHTMNAGDKLTLRYRVIVHEGKWDADRLAKQYDRFAAETVTGGTVIERRERVAILSDRLPNVDDKLVQTLVARLRQDGLDVIELSALQACDKEVLKADDFFLYVIPQCRTYPAAGLEALRAFAEHGGHVLFLGGPLLDDPLWHGRDGWLDRRAILEIKSQAPLTHRPFPADSLHAADWIRTCSDPNNPGAWDVVPEGRQGASCFRFFTRNLTGWDGYLSPVMPALYGPGHDLFAFMAKGTETTTQVAVEIQERDGSRWFATANIGPHWQGIRLDPSDFKYWPDSATRNRRGKEGDRLQPAEAIRVNFQLSQSHTAAVPGGEHTFWIADIGTCANPVADLELKTAASDQSLESIFPRYKVHSLREPVELLASPQQSLLGNVERGRATDVVCAVPRTTGRGLQRDQKWRYIPLIDATDQQGRHRGSPAWLLLNNKDPYRGSAFACLGLNDPEQLSAPAMLDLFSRTVSRLAAGIFLVEAGSEHFSYWPGETVTLGARIANLGDTSARPTVRLTLRDQAGNALLTEVQPVTPLPRDSTSWQKEIRLPTADPATYLVSAELMMDGDVVDRIEHEFAVLDTRTPGGDEFMTVLGNDFHVRGQKWYPVGVNFWPLYVSGMDHADFWAGWNRGEYYDPELVEQDLARMQSLGINLVSIQAHEPQFYRNLLDFVRRCGKHDIYVNLFCGLASPIDFQEVRLRAFLEEARLPDNPTIMAYDTIWEPGNYMFGAEWRPRWNDEWRDWIVERYGSIEAAEADWEFKCLRGEDILGVAPPPERYFREDGPWRGMMAAYRRFMDDLMSRKWNEASRKLRLIDPRHLVSFRQGNTLPHDFALTATVKHIDFICPEGYSIPHSEDGYFTAGFISKFVHFTTNGKPIVWSEFGQSVWDATTMDFSAERIKVVADYHELFYRMALETGANGTIPWWWPGGYRVGERSDYGIVNPDGTPRPAADLISKYGPGLKTPRSWPEPTAWFEMDREAHAGGYWYVCFNTGRAAYQQALAEGKQLGIRTAGTGTTSADTPLVAVGNRPCNGSNPPKYLNAEFNRLQILDAAGDWVDVPHGATIEVAPSTSVRARACVGNTQEATWLAPVAGEPRAGDVLLVTTQASAIQASWPVPGDTPYLRDADFAEIVLTQGIDAPTVVELQMSALQRTRFGEKRRFTITPKAP